MPWYTSICQRFPKNGLFSIFLKAAWQLYPQSVFNFSPSLSPLLIKQKHSACGILSRGRWVAVCQLRTSDKLGWSLKTDSVAPLERLPYLRAFYRTYLRDAFRQIPRSPGRLRLVSHAYFATVYCTFAVLTSRLVLIAQARRAHLKVRAAWRIPASPVIDCSAWRGPLGDEEAEGEHPLPKKTP